MVTTNWTWRNTSSSSNTMRDFLCNVPRVTPDVGLPVFADFPDSACTRWIREGVRMELMKRINGAGSTGASPKRGDCVFRYEATWAGPVWVWALTFALQLRVSDVNVIRAEDGPLNSSIAAVLLVNPSICYCHAGGAILAISSLRHTNTHTHTRTHTHTLWPPADCVWTPGLDLVADGIPVGWELIPPD